MKMYPDLQKYNDHNGEIRRNSFFEQNCNQIFTKGPVLAKEILGKVNTEIVPTKTYRFGHRFKTKRILLTAGLSLLFSTSLFVAVLTWFTNTFDNFVLSQMILRNNSDAFKMWQKPSAKAIYNLYIFNYTNVDDYMDGYADKLSLKQLGPYAYEETLERIDISFPSEDTISFRERRSVNFMPRLSKGRESDMLVVPNLAVIGGSAATKTQGYFARLAYSGILSALDEDAFLEISAGPFITGYKDKLYDLAKAFLPAGTPSEMGLLASKIGESSTRFTINTGEKDMNNYAMVQDIDGQSELDYFSGHTCNSVRGTDGALHPPKLVQNKQPLHYFFPQACRRMPLIFEKETTVLNGQVPAYQYVHPDDIFDSVEEKPENGCYCNMESGQCPLKGIFNVTMCNYDAPMFISHPHFHRADPRLLEHFTGLEPDGKDYKSYFKIHPTMGFTMSVRNMLQLNVQVQKAANVAKVDAFEDGMMLPIAIVEGVLDDNTLPEDIINTINLVTFTAPTIKLTLQYGSPLLAIITLVALLIVLRRKSNDMQKLHSERLIGTNEGYYVAS